MLRLLVPLRYLKIDNVLKVCISSHAGYGDTSKLFIGNFHPSLVASPTFHTTIFPLLYPHWQLTSSTGKPVSHAFAKELLAGIAGAEIDKLAETKGMDFVDREKAKHHAREQTENMYDEHYVQNQGADQYDP